MHVLKIAKVLTVRHARLYNKSRQIKDLRC